MDMGLRLGYKDRLHPKKGREIERGGEGGGIELVDSDWIPELRRHGRTKRAI